MANETTYALISSLLPDIWEAALMYAQENFFMPTIVKTYTDQDGMQDRKVSEYSGGTVATSLGETDDLSTQAFSRSLLATLSPAEIGTQFLVTDRRLASDDVDVMADLSRHIGYTIFKQIETDLAGNFSSFTGGTIDNTGGTLTWQNIYNGRALLAAAAVPPPYNVVLHEYQWLDLATAANIAGIANAGPLRIRDEIQSRYYVGSVGDMDFFATGTEVISAGTAVSAGIFNMDALALDIRRPMRIELERDASKRATEVNATAIYAQGLYRDAWGVTIISDASAPS